MANLDHALVQPGHCRACSTLRCGYGFLTWIRNCWIPGISTFTSSVALPIPLICRVHVRRCVRNHPTSSRMNSRGRNGSTSWLVNVRAVPIRQIGKAATESLAMMIGAEPGAVARSISAEARPREDLRLEMAGASPAAGNRKVDRSRSHRSTKQNGRGLQKMCDCLCCHPSPPLQVLQGSQA